jgi:hypothetical protein
MRQVIPFIYFGSAIAIACMPFSRKRSRAPWARWIFLTIAALFVVLAVCGGALEFQLWVPSKSIRLETDRQLQGIRGILLGCVFVLFVSGEFYGRKNGARHESDLRNDAYPP